MNEGHVFTFYSYKGGVGRTLALANVAALLTHWGFRVLCVDWDLEAPGLHLYFKPWMSESGHPGLLELIEGHINKSETDWKNHLMTVTFPDAPVPLAFMPAGNQKDSYLQRVQKLEWPQLYRKFDIGNYFEALRREWKSEFDFILVDSRTGVTDIGGICTVQMPDFLVFLFTANEQSLFGSIEVVRRARETRTNFPFDRGKLLSLPVITRFEARVEYSLAQKWMKIFAGALAPFYEEWINKRVSVQDVLNYSRVPYIPFWSFGEKLPVIEKGTDDSEDIGYSLENLAALIAHRFSDSSLLVENRDSYIHTARRLKSRGIAKMTAEVADKIPRKQVYIIAAAQDAALRKSLTRHLKALERQNLISTFSAPAKNEKQATEQLSRADIILLLISPDFIASERIYQTELQLANQRAEESGAVILPVLLRPVHEKSLPLAEMALLPANGLPVVSWKNRDEAWLQVVDAVYQAVGEGLVS